MTHEVVERIREKSDRLAELAPECEALGRLTDETARILRDSGAVRLLQPREHGGYEAHPRDFVEAVAATAAADPAAGWMLGVVGVHPWELAMADPRLREELWGGHPDVWIASPYSFGGLARRVDGGYLLDGHWQFSTGTDHCEWVVLGAVAGDAAGVPSSPPGLLHVVLPRSDYTIVDDSWDTVGLRGTGSKDVVIQGAFVPDHRTIDAAAAMGGTLAESAGRQETLYRMPFWAMFPLGLTAATIGICEGALAAHLAYQKHRVLAAGVKVTDDPYILHAVSEAAAEIAASRAHLIANICSTYDTIEAGGSVSWDDRAAIRRDQIRAAWRAVSAVDEIFARSGGNALRLDQPLQRYWRDAHAALNHAIHTTGSVYHAAALSSLEADVPPTLRMLI